MVVVLHPHIIPRRAGPWVECELTYCGGHMGSALPQTHSQRPGAEHLHCW